MYLKRKKFRLKILIVFLLFLSLFFIFLNSNKKLFQKEFFYLVDVLDSNLSKTTTFSELFGYTNIYTMGETYIEIIQTALKNTPLLLQNVYKYYTTSEYEFEKLELNFKFNDYKKLLKDRLESIKNNIGVVDRNEVDGLLKHNGKTYKIESSIKGKLVDHFRSPERFSLKVTLKNNEYFYGMREFSVQKPESRASPYEQIFLEISKNLGFIIPNHKFLKVNFNDKDWGIMNIEENPSRETLELQQFTGDLIFQFGNEKNKFLEKKFFFNKPNDSIVNLETFPIRFLDKKRSNKNQFFINNLIKEKFNGNIYNFFDHEKMCMLALLSVIWGSSHVLELNNTQYAYNIYSRKIVPIPQDVAFFPKRLSNNVPEITRLYAMSCSKIKDKNILLDKIKVAIQNSSEKINHLEKQFPINRNFNKKVLYQNINFLKNNVNYLKIFDDRFPIKKIIYPKKALKKLDLLNINIFREKGIYYLTLGNQIKSNIYVKSLVFSRNNKLIKNKIIVNKTIRGMYFDNYEEYLEKKSRSNLQIKIDPKVVNLKMNKIYFNIIVDDININYFISKNFKVIDTDVHNEDKENYSYFNIVDNNFVWKKGNWTVTKPLIIKKNLHINAGTKINFINNSYVYLNGKLKILGNEKNKVEMYSSDKSWKGIHVNSNDKSKSSVINNAIFSNLNSYIDDKFKMNGGINFYNSDIKIKNVKIFNVYAEDAINFINSSFLIENLVIENAESDGIDSDYSKGLIKNSIFRNISGDAVDTSGSQVEVIETSFENIMDKGISAGEKSKVQLKNISFNNCLICIVSKDDSDVNINKFNVKNYKLYFAASFKKKNFYAKGGQLNFNDSSTNDLKSLRIVKDNKSTVTLNNKSIHTEINDNFRYFYDKGVFN